MTKKKKRDVDFAEADRRSRGITTGRGDGVDRVAHPAHYNKHPSGVECIDVVEHMSFNVGNAVKYAWRADHKADSPIEDLKKARWYLDREIKRLSRRSPL